MSAFLCSDAHINALVAFAKRQRLLPEMTPSEAGQLLFDENVRSLDARYGEEGYKAYNYKPDCTTRKAVEIIKLCHCYDYQACETEDYEQSRAHDLIDRIERRAITMIPGYDEAPWGI